MKHHGAGTVNRTQRQIQAERKFEDPPKLAKKVSSQDEKLNCYRRVRDEISSYIKTLPQAIENTDNNRRTPNDI